MVSQNFSFETDFALLVAASAMVLLTQNEIATDSYRELFVNSNEAGKVPILFCR